MPSRASRALLEQNSCANLARASWLRISDAKQVLGIIDAVLGNQFAAAYTWYRRQPAFTNLESSSFRTGQACPAPGQSDDTDRITAYSMRGTFLTCAIFAVSAFLWALGVKSHQRYFKHAEVAKVGEVAKAASAPAVSVSHL